MSDTIALVDDDRNILTSVSIALEGEGYRVRSFGDGSEALKGLAAQPADLVVLDIKMPRIDGMEVLTRLRRVSDVPVIFLTSRDDEVDEVLGLKMGADDYIKKPFSMRLLIERIKAVLRRREALTATPESEKKIIVREWHGDEVKLTVTEFLILEALAQRPGHVKTRDQLMDAAYDDNVYVDDRTIDSHIKRLRKKFKMVDEDFSAIDTLYGVGYRFRET